jgi:Replication-relaxation
MESPRLPRFERTSAVAPFDLTQRDRDIIRQVNRHRFLRSSHIVALVGGSSQQVLRRLQLLYHHRYLERPRCQLDFYYKTGSQPIAYGLGDRGAYLLRESGVDFPHPRSSEKNSAVTRPYLEHALSVSDVMVALELSCRKHGHALFVAKDEFPTPQDGMELPSRWSVEVRPGLTLGLIPDRVFALDTPDSGRACFFVEADRGTMPVVRTDLFQTSMYRKLLAYAATWRQGVHRSHFGLPRFRVLIITTGSERIQSLVDACSRLEYGHNLFLFGYADQLASDNVLALPLRTGRASETSTLLD